MKNIYLAGGCFWCISGSFLDLKGISDVVSGYSGGDEINPSYEDVKHQLTGHRETIKLTYDENIISINEILEIFFRSVDPFDYDGQFIDKGHSYTLAFYYQNDEEKNIFENFVNEKKKLLNMDVAIAVEPFKSFYIADEYHQKFPIYHPEEYEKELEESGRKNKK